jgi:hypothetical protein
MLHKQILRPDRLRQVPAQFSWIDHRLVRDNFLRHGDPAAWALYLVLVTVADAQGLSYYSDATLGRLLRLDPVALSCARQQLIAADLLACQKPFTQVLSLPSLTSVNAPTSRSGAARSVGDILRQALGGGTHD